MERFLRKGYSSGADFNVDRVLDLMDGEFVLSTEDIPAVQKTNDQYLRVLKNKKGCNKHFKDELLAVGWQV